MFTSLELLLVYAICLVAAGCFGSTTTEGVRLFTLFGAVFLVASNLTVLIVLPALAPVRQSAAFVFTTFYGADTSSSGIPNNA